MNIHTFIKRLKANDFKVVKNGHKFKETNVLRSILSNLEFRLKYHTEKLAEKDYHRKILDMMESSSAYGPNVKWMDGMDAEVYCWCCGNRGLRLSFLNIDTLQVVQCRDNSTPDICQIKDEPFKTQIQIPTGKVVFTNWFKTAEAPEGKEYGNDYCINALIGRFNTAKYLAENGFGYGQMGNSSVTIYRSKDRKSIKVIDGDIDYVIEEFEWCFENGKMDEITNEMAAAYKVYKFMDSKYDRMGSISMSVWRWMCADESIAKDIEKSDETIDTFDIHPGAWEITHNYDHDRDSVFASEMRLI